MADLDWKQIVKRLHSDPEFGAGLKGHIEVELAGARADSSDRYAGYLDNLGGIGVFAVKGTVFIPRFTKAFGDWLLEPDHLRPEITGVEEVETDDSWPYFHGKASYLVRTAHTALDDAVVVNAEEYVESGPPRVLYPYDLERFDLLSICRVDLLAHRDEVYTEGILRFLASQ